MIAAARFLAGVSLSWLAITAATFFLIRAMPGDPAELFLDGVNSRSGPEVVAAYRAAWGLDGSLFSQFIRWLGGFLTLDWGVSYETGGRVATDFAARLPWSIAIGFGGMAGAVALGAALGFEAAYRPRGLADSASRIMAIAGQALPAFAVGLILLWVLGVQLRWISPFRGGLAERLLLPTLLVAFFSIGSVSRLVRAGLVEAIASPWFRTALAKGGSRRGAMWRHGMSHASLVLLAGLAPELAWIVGGTAVAEIVFAVPGVSERVAQAISHRDYAVVQPYVAIIALWIIVILSLAASLRRRLDPRLS